ncbi:MAG: serine/threonine-protein kinase [Microthrixaceae bacterium]
MSWLDPCTDLETGQRVAVKVIEPHREIDRIDETIFEREQNIKHLRHPNIAHLHDSGRLSDSGQFFLVFDWVENDLERWVDQHRPLLPDDFIEQIALPMAAALAFAHEHDVVHRDVKPTNVLITDDGKPQLADFGISKVKNQLIESGPTVVEFVSRPFAPPEGHHTSSYGRDVFSFGVLLLWCLSEVPVNDYGDFQDALDDIDANPELLDLIGRCINMDEEERPRTAVEVYSRLEDIQVARRQHWIPAPLSPSSPDQDGSDAT